MGYKQIKISQPLGIQINCIPKLCTISYNCKLFLIKFLHKLEPKPHKPIVKSSLQHLKFTHFSVLPGFLMKDSQKNDEFGTNTFFSNNYISALAIFTQPIGMGQISKKNYFSIIY